MYDSSPMHESSCPIPTEALKGMPAFELPHDELMRSSRGQHLSGILADPALATASVVQRVAAERALLSVRERSSYQLRDCFVADSPSPRTSNGIQQPKTRTALLAMRREELQAANAAIGQEPRLTLPVGVQPGAPGKRPDAKRFTHHDVERNKLAR